ncbi:hypothetical protein AVEN_139088-1, partial [Araneus ventricosus]
TNTSKIPSRVFTTYTSDQSPGTQSGHGVSTLQARMNTGLGSSHISSGISTVLPSFDWWQNTRRNCVPPPHDWLQALHSPICQLKWKTNYSRPSL